MYTAVVVIHTLACFALILIVLLQTGKGAEIGAAFGGASQTLFGGSGGGTFFGKLTTGAAIVFMLTCLGLTYLSGGPPTKSIMENVPVEKSQGPALPEAKPVQPSAEKPVPAAPSAKTAESSGQSAAKQPAAKTAAEQTATPPAQTAPSAGEARQPEKAPATAPKQ